MFFVVWSGVEWSGGERERLNKIKIANQKCPNDWVNTKMSGLKWVDINPFGL